MKYPLVLVEQEPMQQDHADQKQIHVKSALDKTELQICSFGLLTAKAYAKQCRQEIVNLNQSVAEKDDKIETLNEENKNKNDDIERLVAELSAAKKQITNMKRQKVYQTSTRFGEGDDATNDRRNTNNANNKAEAETTLTKFCHGDEERIATVLSSLVRDKEIKIAQDKTTISKLVIADATINTFRLMQAISNNRRGTNERGISSSTEISFICSFI